MSKSEIRNEQGTCPKCGNNYLEYGKIDTGGGDIIKYPYTCNECEFDGFEIYELSFISHSDKGGNYYGEDKFDK